MPLLTIKFVRTIMLSGCLSTSACFCACPSGCASCQHDTLQSSGRNFTKFWLMMQFRQQMKWWGCDGWGVSITARSNISVSYCGDVDISSILLLYNMWRVTLMFSMSAVAIIVIVTLIVDKLKIFSLFVCCLTLLIKADFILVMLLYIGLCSVRKGHTSKPHGP